MTSKYRRIFSLSRESWKRDAGTLPFFALCLHPGAGRTGLPWSAAIADGEGLLRQTSKTIETRAHTTKDGRLNLSVDVEVPDADVDVVVTVTPVPVGSRVDENGWPEGFFDRVAGSMPDLHRGSQGEFEERLPLE
jgi:hypothetical protein